MFIFNDMELYAMGIVGILFLILLLYYGVSYARPMREARRAEGLPRSTRQPPVSILLYAKNKGDSLRQHLSALLTQDYPKYQVVVINDGSNDDTEEILSEFQQTYPHLYRTYIPTDARYLSRRKLAFTIGAKAAKYNILLFTEANCQPFSEHWLSAMVSAYSPLTRIVLGFCAYEDHPGFLHKLIAYDNLLTGLRYLSSALAQDPYAGDGRNLSYRKELFFKHQGYRQNLYLHAGADDLFVNEVATGENTRVLLSPDSLTRMDPVHRFAQWKAMKIARVATCSHYKGYAFAFYRLESICFFLFQVATLGAIGIGWMGNGLLAIFALFLYALRFAAKAFVFRSSALQFRQSPHSAWLFLLEFILPILHLYFYLIHCFSSKKDYTWTKEE